MSSQCIRQACYSYAPLKHVIFVFQDSTKRFYEAPTLDQTPVKFFVISNSVNMSVLNSSILSIAHKVAYLFLRDFKNHLLFGIEKTY